jgi:hypothetical protein
MSVYQHHRIRTSLTMMVGSPCELTIDILGELWPQTRVYRLSGTKALLHEHCKRAYPLCSTLKAPAAGNNN